MTLKECYTILGVARSAKLEDVKRAYRRRAFELHPDLNPKLVDAGRQFQLLNEAYVILTRVLAPHGAEDGKSGKASSTHTKGTNRSSKESSGKEKAATQDSDTSTQSSNPDNEAASDASQKTHQKEGQEKQEEKHAAHESAPETGDTSDTKEENSRRRRNSAYAQHEEVLRDILNDQFARRVFEDIYQEVNRQEGTQAADAPGPRAIPSSPPKSKKLNVEWGTRVFKLDLTHGITGAVKSWLLRQIDDSLTVKLPRVKLFPGARVRLQIRQGLNHDLRVVEVTLPQDFKPNKAFRLKGLGRKVGRWTGDLYLTVEPQD